MKPCDCAKDARTIRVTSPRDAEERVFEALDEVYRLPDATALRVAGFAAGQIGAFLADRARLAERGEVADEAWEQLADLREICGELLEDLAMARIRRAS